MDRFIRKQPSDRWIPTSNAKPTKPQGRARTYLGGLTRPTSTSLRSRDKESPPSPCSIENGTIPRRTPAATCAAPWAAGSAGAVRADGRCGAAEAARGQTCAAPHGEGKGPAGPDHDAGGVRSTSDVVCRLAQIERTSRGSDSGSIARLTPQQDDFHEASAPVRAEGISEAIETKRRRCVERSAGWTCGRWCALHGMLTYLVWFIYMLHPHR